MGRPERRRKQLLDDLKEMRGYWKLEEEALDRTLWRIDYVRSYRPIVRQTRRFDDDDDHHHHDHHHHHHHHYHGGD